MSAGLRRSRFRGMAAPFRRSCGRIRSPVGRRHPSLQCTPPPPCPLLSETWPTVLPTHRMRLTVCCNNPHTPLPLLYRLPCSWSHSSTITSTSTSKNLSSGSYRKYNQTCSVSPSERWRTISAHTNTNVECALRSLPIPRYTSSMYSNQNISSSSSNNNSDIHNSIRVTNSTQSTSLHTRSSPPT
jgi:hypothetical protein